MNKIKYSIITVCYNAGNSIERTISSVLKQTFRSKEYIIIDGASKDNTINIINKHINDVDLFITEPDNGIYDAMNKGISNSSGEYLIFMNAGDIFVSDDVLENVSNQLNNYPIVHGNIIRCYNHTRRRNSGITKENPQIMDFLFDTFHHQASFIKKEIFEMYGGYSTKTKLCSDWKFFFDCVILKGVKAHYINVDIAYFMMDGISTNHKDDYLNERRSYLSELYGKEIYLDLEELYNYRKSIVARFFMRLRLYAKNNIRIKSFLHYLTYR